MRIWSLHPKYLDSKGLVALWRETLLAKHVLLDLTKGYKNHPQLDRFKKCKHPIDAIDQYLAFVYHEARNRKYNFNKSKVNFDFIEQKLEVTQGQLEYERYHLEKKLKIRDPLKLESFNKDTKLKPHHLFTIVEGGVESWEII